MNFPKQNGQNSVIADLASGGTVTLVAPKIIDNHKSLVIGQTTAGQVITLPAPTDVSIVHTVDVANDGSADFNMHGVNVSVGGFAGFMWQGAAWVPDVGPTATDEVVEVIIPTAQNTVPALSGIPAPGSVAKFFVNGVWEPEGITQVAGVVTVDPAILEYNVAATDKITASYNVL